MQSNLVEIENLNIKDKIFNIRGSQVMIDRDLAELYQVEPKRLNEQVKRNIKRFPKRYMFQLTKEEKNKLVAKCDHLQSLKFSSTNPYVFTEQGVSMLSTVLKSKIAIKVSIDIFRVFTQMRKFLSSNNELLQRLDYAS